MRRSKIASGCLVSCKIWYLRKLSKDRCVVRNEGLQLAHMKHRMYAAVWRELEPVSERAHALSDEEGPAELICQLAARGIGD